MKKLMKKSVGASLLAVILVFSLCMSFVAFADEETVSVEAETGAETAEEAAVEKTAYDPLPPIEMIEEKSETKEEKEQTEETDESSSEVIIERLAKVKKILADIEKNEDFNVKEAYDQYKKLETAEEKAAFVNALSEENNKIFQEYLEAKAEEQELLTKIAAVAEKDPEAAQIIEVEADLKFAEEEIAAAEAEIAALEEEATAEEITEEPAADPAEEKTEETATQAAEELTEKATDETTDTEETKTETAEQDPVAADSVEEKEIESDSVEETETVSTEETVTDEPTAKDSTEEVTGESTETAETEEATAEDTAKETSESEKEESVDAESSNQETQEATDEEIEAENYDAEEHIEKKVNLWYEYDGEACFGKQVTICSSVQGYKNPSNYQWLYSVDGVNYIEIEDATDTTLTFVLDETNAWYYWDLRIEDVEY